MTVLRIPDNRTKGGTKEVAVNIRTMNQMMAQVDKAKELGYGIKQIRVNPRGYKALAVLGVRFVPDKTLRGSSYIIEFEDRVL